MKKIVVYMACVITIGIFSGTAWSQEKDYSIYSQEGREFEVKEIYAPRYPDRLCPPEYPGAREQVESYLSGGMGQRFQQRQGTAAPRSSASFELLDEVVDAEACRHFNEQFDEKINTQAKLSEDGQAQYWYDVTYYKGGDFYFVVSDGGILEEDDPEHPDWIRSVMKTSPVYDSVLVFRKDNYEYVPHIYEPLEPSSAKDQ